MESHSQVPVVKTSIYFGEEREHNSTHNRSILGLTSLHDDRVADRSPGFREKNNFLFFISTKLKSRCCETTGKLFWVSFYFSRSILCSVLCPWHLKISIYGIIWKSRVLCSYIQIAWREAGDTIMRREAGLFITVFFFVLVLQFPYESLQISFSTGHFLQEQSLLNSNCPSTCLFNSKCDKSFSLLLDPEFFIILL